MADPGEIPATIAGTKPPWLEEEEEEVEIGESFPQLDPQNVAEARAEELAYVQRRGLWTVVPVPEVVVPVSVRWIDVLKAEGITRSRLVGLQGQRLGARRSVRAHPAIGGSPHVTQPGCYLYSVSGAS